jgi:hypothetical protein
VAALLDELMPTYDVRERHRTRVRASATTTYDALHETDLAAAPLVRALFALRALPGALLHGRRGLAALRARGRTPATLRTLARSGFPVVAERAPEEVVIGVEGRFWTLGGGICTPAAAAFRDAPQAPGTARAVWSFSVRDVGAGVTELATETRVRCADAAARRRFLLYWVAVRPGSGLIRRSMLRAIRRTAERSPPGRGGAAPAA